jgi:malate synthase
LKDGRVVDLALVGQVMDGELARMRAELSDAQFEASQYPEAASLLRALVQSQTFVEFLTLPAYDRLKSN